MDNRLYWLWLAGVLGFASPQAGTLLDLYGGAENLWQARDSEDFSTLLGAKQQTWGLHDAGRDRTDAD